MHGWVVSAQGDVGRQEREDRRAGLQPEGAPQLGELPTVTVAGVSLLDVLPHLDVLHHHTQTLTHSLAVQVAISQTDGTGLIN